MSSTRFKLSRRAVINKVLALLSGSAVSQIVKVVTLLLVARQLGAEAYGLYVAAITVTGVSAVIFNWGLNTWLLREGARDEDLLPKLTGTVLAVKFGFGLIWLIIIVAIFYRLNLPTFPPELVAAAAIVVWLENTLVTGLIVFKTLLRNYLVSTIEAATAMALLVGTVFFIYADRPDVIFYLQIRLAVLLASVVITWLLIWRWLHIGVWFGRIGHILRQAFPYALADMLAWLSTRADVTLMVFLLGEYYVGIYSPAVGLISTLYFIPGAILGVMVPVLSNLFATDTAQAVRSSRNTIVLLSVVGVFLTTIVLLGADFVEVVLGPSFALSKTVLRIISFVLIFKSISFAMAIILVAVGKQVRRTAILAGFVVLNVALNVAIMPIWGVIGAAVVYVITEAALTAGYTWQAWPHFKAIRAGTMSRPAPVDEVVP